MAQYAPELVEGKAAGEFDVLRTAWRERLPADGAEAGQHASSAKWLPDMLRTPTT